MKINSLSSKPLYLQVKDSLIEEIITGKYKPNEQLPSESELCDKYSVSRITIRKALQKLSEDGYLTRRQGKGTYVTNIKIEKELISFNSYSQYIENIGEIPKNKILSKETIPASYLSKEIVNSLKVDSETPILELKRLHYISEEPFVLETSYYSLRFFPLLNTDIEDNLSTYDILKSKYNAYPYSSQKMLSGKLADSEMIKNLNLDNGENIFEIKEVVYSKQEVPLHLSISIWPASKVIFTFNTSINDND